MASKMSSLVSKEGTFECWSGDSDALLWLSTIKELEQKEPILTKAAPGKMKGREKVSVPEASKEPECSDTPAKYSGEASILDSSKVTIKVNINVSCPSGFQLGDPEDFPYVKYMYAKDADDAIIAVHRFRPVEQGNTCEFVVEGNTIKTVTPFAYSNLYGIWKGDTLEL
mmetsp:Transcript_15682/g.36652  ORF Transcript_15682/g.36652 Transcript_15682/m.36652 type:complete len:169 (-) Transcript_15682:195-701(-)|eukprot:CAMPEP_0171091150 /NCGR_PEP_ID=MMETSP0766_2-20121228/32263_1 /TAXON_ID=439317 /ORGANISM="Gambierdiscus australes, Strain CAWD 149" /LENGTH=168 /DNA_ID=CAMNT_0011549215 /DNA_START=46 /DNA_END=552 /DNA_ORIENTATION=+